MARLIFLLFLFYSCKQDSENNEFYLNYGGAWTIDELYFITNDLTQEGYNKFGFESRNNMWFIKREDNKKGQFINCKYIFYKKQDSLMVHVYDCEDERLSANFNLYIDTISEYKEQYLIELSFDSEKTFMSAFRYLNK
ncbi:MAG: hypothetical protein ACK4UK_03145 [Flavobacterium sp.]